MSGAPSIFTPEISPRLAPFADRRDAGRRLAHMLRDLAAAGPVVVALPRGGVPVAAEIAVAPRAPEQPVDAPPELAKVLAVLVVPHSREV